MPRTAVLCAHAVPLNALERLVDGDLVLGSEHALGLFDDDPRVENALEMTVELDLLSVEAVTQVRLALLLRLLDLGNATTVRRVELQPRAVGQTDAATGKPQDLGHPVRKLVEDRVHLVRRQQGTGD
jgi:hypothetical protein